MTNGIQLIATLPSDLPSPLAGKLAEITGCCYGLKQANHEYDKDLINLLTAGGLVPTASDHHSFYKQSPLNPADALTLNMHVDDGWYITCSHTLRDYLKAILQRRYGPIAFIDASTGVKLTRHPDYSCALDQGAQIIKFLHQSGIDLVPPALIPSTADFFNPPTNLTPVDRTRSLRVNGTLVFLLPIRHDIRKEVIHLCTRNSNPTQSDLTKQIHVLRYLEGCPHIGPTFSSDPSAVGVPVRVRVGSGALILVKVRVKVMIKVKEVVRDLVPVGLRVPMRVRVAVSTHIKFKVKFKVKEVIRVPVGVPVRVRVKSGVLILIQVKVKVMIKVKVVIWPIIFTALHWHSLYQLTGHWKHL